MRSGTYTPIQPTTGGETDTHSDHVFSAVDEMFPPVLLDVVLELHAQRAVIVKPVEAVVNVRRRKHEPAALAEAHLIE